MPTSVGEGLGRLQVRSRAGVLVDSSKDLHLYINGQDQGVVAKHVVQPCFAVFSLSESVIKVRDTGTIYITYRSLGLPGDLITVT